jgi:acyl-CoA synthetase
MARLLTLHDPSEARAYYGSGEWRSDTLYSLTAGNAARNPNGFALRDHHHRLTWAQLVNQADIVASDLHARGLAPGERVSVWMSNRIEAVVVFLACSRNGYVFSTSLHQTYTVDEVATLLERVSSRALFAQVGHGADGRRASIFDRAAELALSGLFALPPPGAEASDLPATAAPFPVTLQPQTEPTADPDAIVYLAFTSGTTGAPKGVMHSSNTLLANARAMVADWGHGPDDVLLTLSQMSHHIGTVALDQALVAGMELVLFDPSAGIAPVDWIADTGATYVMGVPTHAIDVLAELKRRGSDQLARVKTFYLAGAPIPTETAERLLAMGVRPQNVYGMTENGSHQYTLPDDDTATITGTCGRACRAYEVKLWDPADLDREVAAGEVGEIAGRGAMRMLGYFDNQDATERSFNRHGWFLSGDLGRFDARDNLQIVGRGKDIIIRGGHNIHPARVEDLAMRHAAVGKAAAIGVPDERLGERVCLAITLADDSSAPPAADDVLAFLSRSGLSRYDMPEYLAVLDEFPLGPTGKVLKRELVNWLADGRLPLQPVRWSGGQGAAA